MTAEVYKTVTWRWCAVYDDGEVLVEEPGVAFADIDLSRLVYFMLIPSDVNFPTHALRSSKEDNWRPIFFRRRGVLLKTDGEIEGKESELIATCLGWQKTVNGKNIQSFTFFLPDGSVIVTDDRNAI